MSGTTNEDLGSIEIDGDKTKYFEQRLSKTPKNIRMNRRSLMTSSNEGKEQYSALRDCSNDFNEFE